MSYHNQMVTCGNGYYGKQAQTGYGAPSFRVYDPQQGGSITSFITGLAKSVIPYFRSTVAPRILPAAINTAQNILSDAVSGVALKESAKKRAFEGLKKIVIKNNKSVAPKKRKIVNTTKKKAAKRKTTANGVNATKRRRIKHKHAF